MDEKPRLSQRSLETLMIAILTLETDKNLMSGLLPGDVLQSWVLEQMPYSGPEFGPITKKLLKR